MKYRKKPVVIYAVQYDGNNFLDVHENFPEMKFAKDEFGGKNLLIFTLEGQHIATPGDWIIRGVKGEFYPCKPDIFQATYEPAS